MDENKYYLAPKQKSDVQFNGEKFSPSWAKPFIISVEHEFDDRFDILKKQYEELIENIQLNNLIYSSEIRFVPVVGHTYHLYRIGADKYTLSLIAPWEWKRDFVISVKFNHNGKWEKVN